MTSSRKQQKAKSRQKRRRAADGPWYDRRQVNVPAELREVKRLYWRVCQRCRRAGVSLGRPGKISRDVRDLMASIRDLPAEELRARLRGIRRRVRQLESLVDRAGDDL